MQIVCETLEMVRGSYYDTLTLAKGETFSCFTMFDAPLSLQKPITLTNMLQPYAIPVYINFMVRRLRMEIVEGCTEDVACVRQCLVQLNLACKPYWLTRTCE